MHNVEKKELKTWRYKILKRQSIQNSKQMKYKKLKYTKMLYCMANQNIYFIMLILLTKQI